MDEIYRTSPVIYIRYKSQEEDVKLLLKDQEDRYEFAPNYETAKVIFDMEIPKGSHSSKKEKGVDIALTRKNLKMIRLNDKGF